MTRNRLLVELSVLFILAAVMAVVVIVQALEANP